MSEQRNKPILLIPLDIKDRRLREAEDARRKAQEAEDAQRDRDRLVKAGNRVADLGREYELEQKADREYLGRWVGAMAAYGVLLADRGLLGRLAQPPATFGEHYRDAWQVAVSVFLATGANPEGAAATLADLAATVPDLAVSVARCLRHRVRSVAEGYEVGRVLGASPERPPSAGPLDAGDTLDSEEQPGSSPSAVDKITQAIALKQKYPDWTAKRIAETVGCKQSNLSQSRRWQTVLEALRKTGRQDSPREGGDRRGKDRGGKHRGRDMDEYATSARDQPATGPATGPKCAGCGDPAGTDAAGNPLLHEGKPRCCECWAELTGQEVP